MTTSSRHRTTIPMILGGLALVAALGIAALVAVVAYFVYILQAGGGGMDPALAGLAVGKPAPAIAADAWVNSEPSSLDGKVVVVHGWFYNCPYCWDEAPHIAALQKKYGDRVAFVSLTTDRVEDRELVEEFVAEGGLTHPVGYGYESARTLMQGFEATAFPVVWVVGSDGKIVWNRSLEGDQSLEQAIEAALGA